MGTPPQPSKQGEESQWPRDTDAQEKGGTPAARPWPCPWCCRPLRGCEAGWPSLLTGVCSLRKDSKFTEAAALSEVEEPLRRRSIARGWLCGTFPALSIYPGPPGCLGPRPSGRKGQSNCGFAFSGREGRVLGNVDLYRKPSVAPSKRPARHGQRSPGTRLPPQDGPEEPLSALSRLPSLPWVPHLSYSLTHAGTTPPSQSSKPSQEPRG